MAKWPCFLVVMLFLVPVGINKSTSVDNFNNENVDYRSDFAFHPFNIQHSFHSIFSDFIYRFIIKMRNYAPVALMKKYYYDGIAGKEIVFDASSSYDPNGDKLYYRWDFDNDGVYDTPWLSSPKIRHVYENAYDGYAKLQVSDGKATDECIARVIIKNTASITGEVDQSQEKSDGYVKIYEDKFFAQSFKPSVCGIDRIDLLIARKGILSSKNTMSKVFSRLFRNVRVTSIFLGDLIVGIYGKLGDIFTDKEVRESLVFETRISPDRIGRTATWIHIDLDAELFCNRTYYIVVYQDGGNQYQYYKWYYGTGDPYNRGSSYSEENYDWNWRENKDRDFCFRTYGYRTGNEPDGVEERWAVIFGCLDTFMGINHCADQDAYDLRDTLVSHGWDPSHIKVVISPTFNDVKNAMEWLASVDDMDDIDLAAWTSHGGKYGFYVKDRGINYEKDMDPWLDKCKVKGIFIAISTCGSGGAIQFLAKEGRVIMTSCRDDEASSVDRMIGNSVFFYFLADPTAGALNGREFDKNNNGWVSAEEVFPYVSQKVPEYVEKRWGVPDAQHPQLYDGYPGDLDVTRFY